MSAEEMRVELESFVNRGLEEGWCGWPTRSQGSGRDELTTACCVVPTAAMLLRYAKQSALPGPMFPLSPGTPGFGRDRPFLRHYW